MCYELYSTSMTCIYCNILYITIELYYRTWHFDIYNLVTIKHGPALWSSHLILVQRAPP